MVLVNKNMQNASNIYPLHKKFLWTFDSLPIAKGKIVCYNIDTNQGGRSNEKVSLDFRWKAKKKVNARDKEKKNNTAVLRMDIDKRP